MAMAMAMGSSWNPQFPSNIILLCCLFFTLYYFPLHATALSFNFTNITATLHNSLIPVDSSAYITNEGIQVTPNERDQAQSSKAGRARYRDLLHLWDKASGNLTDFSTYFMFVIDSNRSNDYGDGLTFFLVSNDSTPNITQGRAIGLPVDPQTFEPTSPFVAVEFDTYPNKGSAVYADTTTHVGIDINLLATYFVKASYSSTRGRVRVIKEGYSSLQS